MNIHPLRRSSVLAPALSLIAFIVPLVSLAQAPLTAEQVAALRTAKTVSIVVEAQGRAADLGFARVARTLFTCAGVKVVDAKSGPPDVVLKVQADAAPIGAEYVRTDSSGAAIHPEQRHTRYTGGALNGTLVFEMNGAPLYRRPFSATEEPSFYASQRPGVTNVLLEAGGSFLPVLMDIVAQAHGPRFLVALLAAYDGQVDYQRPAKVALRAMAPLDNRAVLETVRQIVLARDPFGHESAIRILQLMDSPPPADLLLAGLKDSDALVVKASAETVIARSVLDAQLVEPLIAALARTSDPYEERTIADALTCVTDEDFGTTSAKWRSWWKQNQGKVAAIPDAKPPSIAGLWREYLYWDVRGLTNVTYNGLYRLDVSSAGVPTGSLLHEKRHIIDRIALSKGVLTFVRDTDFMRAEYTLRLQPDGTLSGSQEMDHKTKVVWERVR